MWKSDVQMDLLDLVYLPFSVPLGAASSLLRTRPSSLHQHPPVPDQSHSVSQSTQSMPQSFVPQGRPVIPPTPNSYEMYGETGRFLQQQSHMDAQQRAFIEQRYQVRKDDAIAFTPMVSPAGTPQYNIIPEYTTPGAYFSPLTSPMLQAQLQRGLPFDCYLVQS